MRPFADLFFVPNDDGGRLFRARLFDRGPTTAPPRTGRTPSRGPEIIPKRFPGEQCRIKANGARTLLRIKYTVLTASESANQYHRSGRSAIASSRKSTAGRRRRVPLAVYSAGFGGGGDGRSVFTSPRTLPCPATCPDSKFMARARYYRTAVRKPSWATH